jgi:hypothetical protein
VSIHTFGKITRGKTVFRKAASRNISRIATGIATTTKPCSPKQVSWGSLEIKVTRAGKTKVKKKGGKRVPTGMLP